jgi:hypothetical protein
VMMVLVGWGVLGVLEGDSVFLGVAVSTENFVFLPVGFCEGAVEFWSSDTPAIPVPEALESVMVASSVGEHANKRKCMNIMPMIHGFQAKRLMIRKKTPRLKFFIF